MTGERLAWFRVASHLHTSVQALAESITFSEFLGWLDFLAWTESRTGKDELYLAQIAAEVRRGYVKHPRTVKTKDFILKPQAKPPSTASGSKAVWLKALNIKEPK